MLNSRSGHFADDQPKCGGFLRSKHDGFMLTTLLRVRLSGMLLLRAPLITEAHAILDGVRLATDHHFQHVEIETDVQEVLNLTEHPSGGRYELRAYVRRLSSLVGIFLTTSLCILGG